MSRQLPDLAATTGSASVDIDADPAAVYELIADIERMGEWSPETFRTRWLRGSNRAVPGARFRGWNRRGLQVWPTDPVIVVADSGRVLAFETTFLGRGRFTRWRYDLEPLEGGRTRLTESWEQIGAVPGFTKRFLSPARVDQLHQGMADTLARIKVAAES